MGKEEQEYDFYLLWKVNQFLKESIHTSLCFLQYKIVTLIRFYKLVYASFLFFC